MKNLLYAALWLMWIMGTLAIWIVNADDWVLHESRNISYIDTNWNIFTWIWTITLSFWNSSITILDRNLWAKKAWTWCYESWCYDDTFWYYFQWWNNYGFETNGERIIDNIYFWQTDASDYSWNKPYVSWAFIAWIWNRNYTHNQSLWWWGEDTLENEYWLNSITHYQRQWPCPAWYHVPSMWEINSLLSWRWSLYSGWKNLWWKTTLLYYFSNEWLSEKFKNDFLIPLPGFIRNTSWSLDEQWIVTFLWTTSSFSGSIHRTSLNTKWMYNNYSNLYGYWYQIRCFKDNKIYPIISYETNWWTPIQSQTILSWEKWYIPWYLPQKTWAILMWWYKDSIFENNIELSWFSLNLDITGDTIFYVKRWYEYIFLDYDNAVINSWIIAENEHLTAPNGEIKTWYTFIWRFDKISGSEFNFQSSITRNVVIYPKYDLNEYSITFVDESGDNESVIYSWAYNSAIDAQYPTWTKDGYTISWDKEIPAIMPLNGDTITDSWTQNPAPSSNGGWYSGWGGSRNSTKDTQDSQQSWVNSSAEQASPTSQNDNNLSSWATAKDLRWDTQDSSDKVYTASGASEWQEILSPSDSSFTKEQKEAYEFAHKNWITTMDSIDKANMGWKLTRIAMAKMLSYYAINILWQKPDETRNNKFNDITEKLDADYDNWVTLAYQLWIMWINMPNNNFRPNDLVTRAEFATALSRLLRWEKYNVHHTPSHPYYEKHLPALQAEWIMKNIQNPNMEELRWYVMIMLMRSAR